MGHRNSGGDPSWADAQMRCAADVFFGLGLEELAAVAEERVEAISPGA